MNPNYDPAADGYGYAQPQVMAQDSPYVEPNPSFVPPGQQPYMGQDYQVQPEPQVPSYANQPAPANVQSPVPSYAEPQTAQKKKKRRKRRRGEDIGMGAAYVGTQAVSSDKAEYCCYCCVCCTVCAGYLALIFCELFAN